MEWHVWDFPDTVRVYFNEDFRIELFTLLKGNSSRNRLAKKFGISTSIIKSYFQTGKDSEGLKTYIPVKIIKRIPYILSISTNSEFMLRLEKNIVAYRARAGWAVTNPILPIKETSELYSIVAHMICDGSAGKRKTPCYYNTCKELRENLKKCLQVFGNVETNEYEVQNDVYAVMFPKGITDILSHVFQVPFVRTPYLPKLFFTAPKECQFAALRAMFDDEGCISGNQLTFAQKEIGVMNDLKSLLESIEIKTGKITKDGKGCKSITVLSESRKLFWNLIGFLHPVKNKRLKITVKNDIERRSRKLLIEKINELFCKENNLTRTEICKKLNSNINSTTELLYRLKKDGKVNSKFVGKNKSYLWSTASSSE